MALGTLAESYSGTSSDGLMDGVDLSQHIVGSEVGPSSVKLDANTTRLAWGIIMVALAALWFLGGIVFRVSLR